MAHIDYKDNIFFGFCPYDDRAMFRDATGPNQGFKWNKLRKAWVTPDPHIAMAVEGVVWTTRAQAQIDHLLEVARISEELSWKASTDYVVPTPPGLSLLPYQAAGVEYAMMRKDTLIADQPGLGKAQPMDAPVLTPRGWVAIGDLQVGDEVLHPSGSTQQVIGVYDRGLMPVYQVTFNDGSSTKCSGDHLWQYSPRAERRPQGGYHPPVIRVESLDEIQARVKRYARTDRAAFKIPMCAPIEWPHAEHVIHPYILGVLLGDGTFGGRQILFCSDDPETYHEVRSVMHPDMECSSVGDRSFGFRKAVKGQDKNTYVLELTRLGLMGKVGGGKFVPQEYLYDSAENRRSLLQGLMDTDGSVLKDGRQLRFSNKNKNLVDAVVYLTQSLGGTARAKAYVRANSPESVEWTVSLCLPADEMPFRLQRKVQAFKPRSYRPPVRLFRDITQLGTDHVRCIKVSHPDGLYITDDFIVTHNTIQAIGVLNADENVRSALFIVPASLKVNWYREIDKWMVPNLTFGIAHASYTEKVQVGVYKSGKRAGQPRYQNMETQKDVWPDTDIVIINYDILDRFHDKIKERTWDLLVADECHALKGQQSGRTLFVLGGKKDPTKAEKDAARAARQPWPKPTWFTPVDANRRVFLSGTPMMSRPVELWPIAQAFDPNGLGRDYVHFVYQYCEAWHDPYRGKNGALDVSGAGNLEELGEKMRSQFMVRRLKREVLPELPPKRRVVVPMDSPEIRELVAREDELAQALRLYERVTLGQGEEFDEAAHGVQLITNAAKIGFTSDLDPDAPNWRTLDMDYAAAVAGLEPPAVQILFEEMAAIRRELGIAKLSVITPWVSDFLEGGEKLLLFAYHSDVVKAIAERMDNWNPAVIWGGTPLHKRQTQVDKFQEDESCRLFIGNIQAAGVGFTLTRAADVAFAEGDWVPSQIEQCEDRACRIGQTAEKIMSYFLVANGSLDARIAQAAKLKEDNINRAMGA